MAIQKITPHLWYVSEAEEAAAFYVSIFPDSRIERVTALPVETPSGPAGSVEIVDFTLFGQAFNAFSAGPLDPFNHAISFLVRCEDQAELDRYWEAFLAGGGQAEACGWLRDRWGVCWQIAPAGLDDMIADPDRERAARVATAMFSMVKLELAPLRAAYEGR